jgi:hypothetical protein
MDMNQRPLGVAVDLETRRKKQRALIVQMVERKVRERAQQLYDERGQQEGQALNDWVQAESEVLENKTIEPMYRRLRGAVSPSQDSSSNSCEDSSACPTHA